LGLLLLLHMEVTQPQQLSQQLALCKAGSSGSDSE
jgi:hypothetical protein